jgi:hypothetical protein
MNKKLRFLCFCPGLALAVLAGACKPLPADETDPDYLMPLPGGVIVRFETGKGSYVSYQSGLAPDDLVQKPSDPSWPDPAAANFGGWFKDNLIFSEPWDFSTDRIPGNVGKFMNLYARWEGTSTERWVALAWIWNNQPNDIMGQVVKLEPGEEYTLTVKGWMQGGNATQHNHIVAFYVDDTGERKYTVRDKVVRGNLWENFTYTFEAVKEWYVVGVFPGLATEGGGGFFTREMKLIKTGESKNLIPKADFKFGVGLDEDKTYFTQVSLSGALTKNGKSDSFLPGVWYSGSSRLFLVREANFWDWYGNAGSASQGDVVYFDDR